MTMKSFARIQCKVREGKSDDASDIGFARRGNWTTAPAAPDLETL
jgi:hypothetical protein